MVRVVTVGGTRYIDNGLDEVATLQFAEIATVAAVLSATASGVDVVVKAWFILIFHTKLMVQLMPYER